MENKPNLKSKDELRAEELRQLIAEATESNRVAMAALKAAEEKKLETPKKKEPKMVDLPPKPTEEPVKEAKEPLATDEVIDAPVSVLESERIKTYKYVALNGRMEKVKGTVDAFNEEEATIKVKQMALFPHSFELIGEKIPEKEKTEKLARQIIKKAKDILKNLPFPLKNSKKTVAGQTEKKRKAQEDFKIKEGEYAKIKEDLRRAEEALAEAQKDKTKSPLKESKRFSGNQWAKVAALVALLAADVKIAGTNLGWWESNAPTGKNEQKNTAKKETSGIYTSPAINLSAEVEKIKAEEKKNKAESDKKLADQQAEIDAAKERAKKVEEMAARIKAQMQAEKSAPVAQPKTITKEELLAGIEQKIMRAIKDGIDVNKVLTADESNIWNRHLINERPATTTGGTIQIGQKEQVPQPSRTPDQPAMGGFIISRVETGVNFDTPAKIHTNENAEKNPFHLTPKMLERVEEVYEENIDKIFPDDTLQNWRGIKDKSADEFMSKPESKIKKVQKPLYDYLKQLAEKTKLKPKIGVFENHQSETIEQYIGHALQKSAQDGKLDAVELK